MRHLLTRIFALALLALPGCAKQRDQAVIQFDAHEFRGIMYSLSKDGASSIYRMPLSGGSRVALFLGSRSVAFYNPVFSADGNSIAFIRKTAGGADDICIADWNGLGSRAVARIPGRVSELQFDPTGSSIFALAASTYKNSSPVAQARPHGYDLFRVDVASGNIDRLTRFNAYEMRGLTNGPDGSVAFRAALDDGTGLYLCLLGSDRPKLQHMSVTVPARPRTDLYYYPQFDRQKQRMVFIVPYEIYAASIESPRADLVFSNIGREPIHQVRWMGKSVVFSKQGIDSVFILSNARREVREIPLVPQTPER